MYLFFIKNFIFSEKNIYTWLGIIALIAGMFYGNIAHDFLSLFFIIPFTFMLLIFGVLFMFYNAYAEIKEIMILTRSIVKNAKNKKFTSEDREKTIEIVCGKTGRDDFYPKLVNLAIDKVLVKEKVMVEK